MRFIACKINNLLTKTKPKIIFQKKLFTKLFVYFLEYINIIGSTSFAYRVNKQVQY